MARRAPDRNAELSDKATIRKKLLEILSDVDKGFIDQRERADEQLDNWDMFNLKLGDKQFYNGNSRIFVPFIRDAVVARKTRFTNQIFPQSGRYVEATTGEEEVPYATMALLEGYVRRARIRTTVMPALTKNGDVEGQYSLYVSWREAIRNVTRREKVPMKHKGLEFPSLGETDDYVSEEESDDRPEVEVLHDADLLVLPQTVDSLDDAIEQGGSITIRRRWSKAFIRKMIDKGDFANAPGEAMLKEMAKRAADEQKDPSKELAEAAGIKAKGGHVQGYETWTRLKVEGDHRLCRVYFGGENQILGAKLCPYWCDLVPVLSVPLDKIAGVFKGRAPVADVSDLQVLANDTINEGADTAHFSAMPIVMTDPEKNPQESSMVLGLAAVWKTDPKSTQFVVFPELWRSAWERAEAIKGQIFQTLGVNPSMVPQSTGGTKKRNQAEIANEQQVDILTTADAVTVLEEGILTPLLQRFAFYDHQFRDEETTVRIYGEMGMRARMEKVEPIQLNKRFEFKWWGVEAARNAAAMQQQIGLLNVVKEIPPTMYPEHDLRLAPVIAQMMENVFGPRMAPQIFVKKKLISIDPQLENEMLEHGHRVQVHEPDDDAQHLEAHQQALALGDLHGTIREHMEEKGRDAATAADDGWRGFRRRGRSTGGRFAGNAARI